MCSTFEWNRSQLYQCKMRMLQTRFHPKLPISVFITGGMFLQLFCIQQTHTIYNTHITFMIPPILDWSNFPFQHGAESWLTAQRWMFKPGKVKLPNGLWLIHPNLHHSYMNTTSHTTIFETVFVNFASSRQRKEWTLMKSHRCRLTLQLLPRGADTDFLPFPLTAPPITNC